MHDMFMCRPYYGMLTLHHKRKTERLSAPPQYSSRMCMAMLSFTLDPLKEYTAWCSWNQMAMLREERPKQTFTLSCLPLATACAAPCRGAL
jgi:hypothetical protein